MSLVPEEHEPLNIQESSVFRASGDLGSELEDATPPPTRRCRGSWLDRTAMLLLGLVTVGLVRGGFLGWQHHSPPKASPADTQMKNKISPPNVENENVCEAPQGVCTENFLNELLSVSAALLTAQKDVVKNKPLLQKYQKTMNQTCQKDTAMTGLCVSMNTLRRKLPHSIHEFGLPRLQPKLEADLQSEGDASEQYSTTYESYGSIVETLRDTRKDLALQCSNAQGHIFTVCNGLSSPLIPATKKSMSASLAMLEADAQKTVNPLAVSDSSLQASKWNRLFRAKENKLKDDKTELKHRLADEMQVKLDAYKGQIQAWMELKIEGDLADANTEFRATIAEVKEEAHEDQDVSAKKLEEEAEDVLADAIVDAKEENAEKKTQDKAQMENKIEGMKENLKKHLMNSLGYNKQIFQIKEAGAKKVKKNVALLEAKQKKELEDFAAKLETAQIRQAKDAVTSEPHEDATDFQETVRQKQKELDDKLASDVSEYQEGLANGEFKVGSVGMEDYLKVHLTMNDEKRDNLVTQYVQKEKMKLEKKYKKEMSDFKAQGQKVLNHKTPDKIELIKGAKQKIRAKIAEARKRNLDDLQTSRAKWMVDTEAEVHGKIDKIQAAADKVIPGKVAQAETELRIKITKINDGTYDKHLEQAKDGANARAYRAEKQAQREQKQAVQQQIQQARMAFNDAMHRSRDKWGNEAQQLDADKEEELEEEFEAKLEEEFKVLEDRYDLEIQQLRIVQDQSALARQVPEDMGSTIMQSVEPARSICDRLGKIKQNCWAFDASLATNQTLVQMLRIFCKEAAVFQTTCIKAYSWKTTVDNIVGNLQQVHDVAAAGTQWMERTAEVRATCSGGDNTIDEKDSSEKKDRRRLDDENDHTGMQDVVDTCTYLGKEIMDSMDETVHEKEKAIHSAKLIEDNLEDIQSVNDVSMQLRTSRDKVFNKTVKVRHEFKGLMGTVSDRFDSLARGCADFTVAAKVPCGRLPFQWAKYDKLLHDSNYFVQVFHKWVILDVQKTCGEYKKFFTDCVTRFHARQRPMFEFSLTQAWRLENMVQPLVRSIQMGLVLTCIFIFFSHKNPNLLLNTAFFASQAALLCLMIVSFVRGCVPVALGFALLLLASVHRYRKILPRSTFVTVALKCAATALESTLGHKAWIAMIPPLLLQATVLFLSVGTALHLEERCAWSFIPALALPLIAGVWTSEVIACVFRSTIGCAVSLTAMGGGEAGISHSAVKSVLGGHGLGGIAVWSFISALPFRSQSSLSAVDLIEVALPQQAQPTLGHRWSWGHSLWLRNAVEGEGALGSVTDRSFSEALRIIRLALALIFSVVVMGAPMGSVNTAVVAMMAIVIGHTLVAVPVHSLEASLWGFAAAVEEVGSENVKINADLRDLLAKVVIQKREMMQVQFVEI